MDIKNKFTGLTGNLKSNINKAFNSPMSDFKFGKPSKAWMGVMGAGMGLNAVTKWTNNRTTNALQSLYPENMLPTMQGRFGKKTEGLAQSPVQGVKFNFRRG